MSMSPTLIDNPTSLSAILDVLLETSVPIPAKEANKMGLALSALVFEQGDLTLWQALDVKLEFRKDIRL